MVGWLVGRRHLGLLRRFCSSSPSLGAGHELTSPGGQHPGHGIDHHPGHLDPLVQDGVERLRVRCPRSTQVPRYEASSCEHAPTTCCP